MSIYKVDDGSIWYFDAENSQAAREQWIAAVMEQGYDSEEDVLAEYDEARVTLVQLKKAVGIKVRMDDKSEACHHCGGVGQVAATWSLLEVWQENQKADPDKRAHLGILSNSEY